MRKSLSFSYGIEGQFDVVEKEEGGNKEGGEEDVDDWRSFTPPNSWTRRNVLRKKFTKSFSVDDIKLDMGMELEEKRNEEREGNERILKNEQEKQERQTEKEKERAMTKIDEIEERIDVEKIEMEELIEVEKLMEKEELEKQIQMQIENEQDKEKGNKIKRVTRGDKLSEIGKENKKDNGNKKEKIITEIEKFKESKPTRKRKERQDDETSGKNKKRKGSGIKFHYLLFHYLVLNNF